MEVGEKVPRLTEVLCFSLLYLNLLKCFFFFFSRPYLELFVGSSHCFRFWSAWILDAPPSCRSFAPHPPAFTCLRPAVLFPLDLLPWSWIAPVCPCWTLLRIPPRWTPWTTRTTTTALPPSAAMRLPRRRRRLTFPVRCRWEGSLSGSITPCCTRRHFTCIGKKHEHFIAFTFSYIKEEFLICNMKHLMYFKPLPLLYPFVLKIHFSLSVSIRKIRRSSMEVLTMVKPDNR